MAKRKGSGGSVWKANFTMGNCGLVPADAIREGDGCMFLTCLGADASPHAQIIAIGSESYIDQNGDERERTLFEALNGPRMRSVPTGEHKCRRNSCGKVFDRWRRWCSCKSRTKPIFKWQENRGTDDQPRWCDVQTWERVVLVANAEALGYHVPKGRNGEYRRTIAAPGTRTLGHAHRVSDVPESPLMDLARAALTPEELGETEGDDAPPAPPLAPLPGAHNVPKIGGASL